MKAKIFWKLFLTIFTLFLLQTANACTAFGAITEAGTIIGKNRDYYYIPQKFSLVKPIKQFYHWHNNTYQHKNKFYAITSAGNVTMGVNQSGLTGIEEDSLSPLHSKNAAEYKRLQKRQGISYGMILYGTLQNFNTVDEITPYLSKIFSTAAPDFYQFADAKKILIVEVAHGKNSTSTKHKFTYRILSNKNDYFTHTNSYLSPEFVSLNNLISKQESLSSDMRLKKITYLLSHTTARDIYTPSRWFLDTHSHVTSKNNPNLCLNTSLFRSDLQGFKSVNKQTPNDKIFGTVSTLIVSNQGDFKNSHIYLMMIDSITTQENGKQIIKYHALHSTLQKLFGTAQPKFTEHEFVRQSPVNGHCK